jgi:hypothetical protein
MARRHSARNDQEGFGMTARLMKMSVLAEPSFATRTHEPTTPKPAQAGPALAELTALPAAGGRERRRFDSLFRRSSQ